MVLHPFEQPNTLGRSRLDRLHLGVMAAIPAHHSENRRNSFHLTSARIDPFPMADRIAVGATTNEEIHNGRDHGMERVSSDRISDRISVYMPSCRERNRLQWCEQVQNLKQGSKGAQASLPQYVKPFGKFSCHITDTEPTTLTSSPIISPRRVRFQDGTYAKNLVSGGVSMHTSTSTSSTNTNASTKKSVGSLAAEGRISNHRCTSLKVRIFNKQKYEQLFWSRNEVKQIRNEAQLSADSFRAKHPATAQQVGKLFEEFCSSSNNNNNSSSKARNDEEDEENEEILRDFLQDWAASGVRGLEEGVTGRHMFLETRKMGVESVLAYQESLREQQKLASLYTTNALPPRPYEASDRMAELLRARSESTSHRARMFAMYMALGDALVVTVNDEFSYDYVA